MRVAIVTDYPVVSFANGPSLATQALKRNLERRGHAVTIVGPKPGADAPQPEPESLLLQSAPFRAHAGVQLPFAWPPKAFDNVQRFDVVHSHANSSLMHWGPMMRRLHGIPCLSTNTVYVPGFAEYALPKDLCKVGLVRELWARVPARAVETAFAGTYNDGDGLIVQCRGLADYWKGFGLEVPIHVIPRPIDRLVFDRPVGSDPFRPSFARGGRIVVVCRHAREKALDTLLRIFASHVLSACPQASLTLVGDGPDHKELVALAEELRIDDRCDFPGEKPQKDLLDYYANADLFAYTSLTETYGQVISEALWCGVPVVALDDAMGVAFQVAHERDGLLVRRGPSEREDFGAALVRLIRDKRTRRAFGEHAASRARQRVSPEVVYDQYEAAYASAIEHLRRREPGRFDRRSVPHWLGLVNRHVLPWTVQQSLLLALGSLRGGSSYTTPKVRIDALPPESGVIRMAEPASGAERAA